MVERAATSLRRAAAIWLYSPRGGTGTSAIAINLAAALDRIQHGVTLIDTDLQFGDLPVHLNMRPTKSLADLTTSNRPDAETLPDLLLTHSSGINLLFAPPKPETAELITGSMLVQVARRLRDRSTAVVIDTPSYLTDHNLALFDIVNLVLLVVTPDLPSVKNARIFCDMAPHLGLPPERIVLVINRATMLGGIPAPQVEKALGLSRVYQHPGRSQTALLVGEGRDDFPDGCERAVGAGHRTRWRKLVGFDQRAASRLTMRPTPRQAAGRRGQTRLKP